MSRIAVLGLGAMGSRMAAKLIEAGHCLNVWNRTAAAAQALEAVGTRRSATPREAVNGAEFVIAMLRDDAASREVWLDPAQGALAGMAPEAVAIESSTLTPAWVRELGEQARQAGVALLDAPVSGSRAQAEARQLVYLVGGEAAVLARAEPVLAAMGSGIRHAGPLGSGALAKLAANALLGVQVTALAELIGLLAEQGADVERVLSAVAVTSVWAPVAHYLAGSMQAGNFAPQFPVELIGKDFEYLSRTAGERAALPVIEAAGAVFVRAEARGLGALNMTSVVNLYRHDIAEIS
ncbi:NAD(P)-dependent oxidoreductase [Burkholderia gladioli]|uniref:NAD(P)-dependent oxidoreductase n=1 Tax=Burkholderia gladioli TaxID=28095 RepID=UPI001640A8FD|nr:NAD(P)-dependent oxidoreductase [Burkholderia gladioli]MBU9174079.1 NAD(P)-dependent oxidoreductase [Burkholderia gladioli]